MMCSAVEGVSGENCPGKIAVVRGTDGSPLNPETVQQEADVLVWTSPPRPHCSCAKSVEARQLEETPGLDSTQSRLGHCPNVTKFGVDTAACWAEMNRLWDSAVQVDPAERAGLASKVEAEAWELRKVVQNIDLLVSSLNDGNTK